MHGYTLLVINNIRFYFIVHFHGSRFCSRLQSNKDGAPHEKRDRGRRLRRSGRDLFLGEKTTREHRGQIPHISRKDGSDLWSRTASPIRPPPAETMTGTNASSRSPASVDCVPTFLSSIAYQTGVCRTVLFSLHRCYINEPRSQRACITCTAYTWGGS